jgi:type IV pilus assembly protein PilX
MRHVNRFPAKQRGAALAIGLILLLVLTVLAVSGMNTASMELVMAGNEQFRQRASRASETGIELALADLRTVKQTDPVAPIARPITGVPTDTATTTTQYMGDDLNIPGFSAGKFVGIHYQIVSAGTSSRNARVEQTQGAFVIQGTGAGGGSFGSIAGIAAPGDEVTGDDGTGDGDGAGDTGDGDADTGDGETP